MNQALTLQLHPAVAALAASLAAGDQGLEVAEEAVAGVRAALRHEPDEVITHLLAWTLKVSRSVGYEAAAPIRAVVLALLQALPDAGAVARDAWEQELGPAAARRLGALAARAPQAPVTPASAGTVRPMRGLKR